MRSADRLGKGKGADMTERERLTELILNTPKIPVTINGRAQGRTYHTARNVADHLLANGVIVPPVKVGHTVYDYAGRECIVISVHFYNDGLPSFTTERTGYHNVKIHQTHTFNKIGESVFLTREDAEKVLAERAKS